MSFYLRTEKGVDKSTKFNSLDNAVKAAKTDTLGVTECSESGQPIKHYNIKNLKIPDASQPSKKATKPNTEE